jgi:hypothetical protein
MHAECTSTIYFSQERFRYHHEPPPQPHPKSIIIWHQEFTHNFRIALFMQTHMHMRVCASYMCVSHGICASYVCVCLVTSAKLRCPQSLTPSPNPHFTFLPAPFPSSSPKCTSLVKCARLHNSIDLFYRPSQSFPTGKHASKK